MVEFVLYRAANFAHVLNIILMPTVGVLLLHRTTIFFMLIFSFSSSGNYQEAPKQLLIDDKEEKKEIKNFNFQDLTGKSHSFFSVHGSKGLVVFIRDIGCPVASAYTNRVMEFERKYSKAGFKFIFLNFGINNTSKEVAEESNFFGKRSPYVHDVKQSFLKYFQVKTSTEVLVLDSHHRLRYQGAIDDQFGFGYRKDNPTKNYLKDALESLLHKKKIEISRTSAPGCYINLLTGKADKEKKNVSHLFPEVQKIINKRCVSCHRDNGSGPFALQTYEQVKGRATMIKFSLEKKSMPPWFVHESSLPINSNREITKKEQDTIIRWIKEGAPRGPVSTVASNKIAVNQWPMGKPDRIIEVPGEYSIEAGGKEFWRYLIFNPSLKEDLWIKGYSIRASNNKSIHHLLGYVFKDKQGSAKKAHHSQIRTYFFIMVPGQNGMTYPENSAKLLPKNTWFSLIVHFMPSGKKVENNKIQIGLYVGKKPKHILITKSVFSIKFEIPPNTASFEVVAKRKITKDILVYSFLPHMHYRGKSFKYEVIFPDKSRKTLLYIDRYSFHWQFSYVLKKAFFIPAGSEIIGKAIYDNSKSNLTNPDPTKTVTHGGTSSDEMMIGYFDYIEI